jgi:hypothetical protein
MRTRTTNIIFRLLAATIVATSSRHNFRHVLVKTNIRIIIFDLDQAMELINGLTISCMAFINISDSLVVALIIAGLIRQIIHIRNSIIPLFKCLWIVMFCNI